METIILATAALALLEKILPVIAARVKSGEIDPAEQQKLRDHYLALRAQGEKAFTGPEWEIGEK